MKRYVLVKQHSASHIAHMYEHLMVMEANKLLRDNKIFSYVDYSLRGTTYGNSGIIEIDFEFYSQKSASLLEEILSLKVPTDDIALGVVYKQMLAEYGNDIRVTDMQKVYQELDNLNEKQWTHIDDLDAIDSKTLRHRNNPLYRDGSQKRKPSPFTMTYKLDPEFAKNNRELVLLFRHLSAMLDMVVGEELFILKGFYSDSYAFRYSPKDGARAVSKVLVAHGFDDEIDLALAAKSIRETIHNALNNGAGARLLDWLTKMDYSDGNNNIANQASAFSDTGLFVGMKAWRRIATQTNLDSILRHTTMEVKYKKQKREQSLR